MNMNVILDNQPLKNQEDINLSNLDKISNGSIQEINCQILDQLKFNDRISTLIKLLKKIKNGGSLTIKFLDANKIMKDYSNGKIPSQNLSELISEMQSLNSESDLLEIISDNQHFRILKKYHDNYFLIVVLHKKI